VTKVPPKLRAGILAVLVASGGGYAAFSHIDGETTSLLRNQYVQAVAQDGGTSQAVKVAMVMGAYFESSYKHIGTPYVDKLGKGRPLTVCNGITGPAVKLGRYYTPGDCYRLERAVYVENERRLKSTLPQWDGYTVLQQATFVDFLHNLGPGAFDGSTMKRKLLAGDVVGACRENPRWTRGTVNGVSVVLPGLQVRRDASAELCEKGLQ
jgi:lysozyme